MNIASFSFYDLQAPGTMVESPDFAYFKYDSSGNKGSTAVTETIYTYDEQNQSEGVIQSINFAYKENGSDTVTESANYNYYEFDAEGNRSTENAIITTTVYTYNEQNRLTGTVTTGETNESTSFTYDNNGSLLTEQKGTDTTTHSYDEFNQLIQTVKGSTTIKAKYNGEGKRVEREINGAVTRFLYEGSNIILEVNSSGDELARNIYGTNLIQRKVTGVILNYFYNGQGDVTALVNNAGITAATYYYDAFGNNIETTGSANNPIRYRGYQYDDETGLYYLQSRMYCPITARFLQEDSYRGDRRDPLSLNLYTYCHNEPIMYVDPSGNIAIAGEDKYGNQIQYNNNTKKYSYNGVTTKDYNKIKTEKEKVKREQEQAKKEREKRESEAKKKATAKTGKYGNVVVTINQIDSVVTGKNPKPDASKPSSMNNKDSEIIGDYIVKSGKQVLLGNYSGDKPTILGTAGQITAGIFDFDLPGDIRDITYDVTHWEFSSEHIKQTTLDVIGFLPVIGALKYSDEAGTLIKGVSETKLPSTLNPKEINFMQSSIKNETGEYTVLQNAEALKNGTLKPSDLPTMKVWKDESGKIWTLDHRRLGAYRLAELNDVPVQWATQEEIAKGGFKMTTNNGGSSIRLKLGGGESITIK